MPSRLVPHIWWDDLKQTRTYGGKRTIWKQWKYQGPTLKQLVRGSSPRSVTEAPAMGFFVSAGSGFSGDSSLGGTLRGVAYQPPTVGCSANGGWMPPPHGGRCRLEDPGRSPGKTGTFEKMVLFLFKWGQCQPNRHARDRWVARRGTTNFLQKPFSPRELPHIDVQ